MNDVKILVNRRSLLLGAGALLGAAACSERAPEPTSTASATRSGGLEPVIWTTPPTWPMTESSPSKPRRAGYKVPPTGNDKEDGELLVLFFGTGANGDRDKQWDPWFEQFDGAPKESATRDAFDAPAGRVETFEFKGSYKLNLGQQRPGMKKSPVQMVKHDFRMIGAVVKTESRGNWFFRLVGPDETVLAAKDAYLSMLRAVT